MRFQESDLFGFSELVANAWAISTWLRSPAGNIGLNPC
jgi:hypothetical protein